jgi:hypothetical protein
LVEFAILGPLEARRVAGRGVSEAGSARAGDLAPSAPPDGEPIPLGGPKQRALLAMLLLEAGRVVSTDRLVE